MRKLPVLQKTDFFKKKEKRPILLFLDFDGTLAPIVKRPELAKLPAAARKSLEALANQKKIRVVIISGRLLENVKKKVGVSMLTYVGNHGLEMRGKGIRYLHPQAALEKKRLKNIVRSLRKSLRPFDGVWVEDKSYTLSIHYREASAGVEVQAQKVLLKALGSELKSGRAVLTEGKKVWEVRPKIAWNKGAAVKWLCRYYAKTEKAAYRPVYIGDDVTDESAFQVLKGKGLTIKVTRNPLEKSSAEFYVRRPADVHALLKEFCCLTARSQAGV